MEISGEVQGNVIAQSGTSVEVLDSACVHGNIYVEKEAKASIAGEVQGNVVSHGVVQISKSANIHGNVLGNAPSTSGGGASTSSA
ncbi:MAG: polymer-forming cytoskeletal protein [Candidatus Eremiobacteraeota bacterium]|nr:polymer-forming cytoskeletal protein [Candidatus Eremiobacteraeota bacterium]